VKKNMLKEQKNDSKHSRTSKKRSRSRVSHKGYSNGGNLKIRGGRRKRTIKTRNRSKKRW